MTGDRSGVAGQLLCGGLFSPDPVSNWLCSAALSHVFIDTEEMKVTRILG